MAPPLRAVLPMKVQVVTSPVELLCTHSGRLTVCAFMPQEGQALLLRRSRLNTQGPLSTPCRCNHGPERELP